MLLGTVIGTVWATRKDEQLVGMTFLIVREVDLDGQPLANYVVAADSVGAGVGETVLVAQGSSGRQTALTQGKPVDAVIMAIVDRLDVKEGTARIEVRAEATDPLVLPLDEPVNA
ncbi:MAG: EutN/CcmL family microcompartment protein [Rubricoccaceae bacterium]|nr:EutN/CcmL family microcompartment protein [Rubricoccaceae bacterium]